ncbi:MAG: nucleoside hydrolase [Burkholderiaceae bacterium]|nr:nucleoside hydrolase [Burkholderiaceae bacterium]
MTVHSTTYVKPNAVARFLTMALAFLLSAIFSQSSLAQDSRGKPTKPLIVDTDMGTDDWLALIYVAQNKNIDLLGVTIVGNGLASCEDGPDNARHLLSLSERNADKPIGCGSDWPLNGYASYPRIWRETGSDMMGEAPTKDQAPTLYPDGPTLLARLLREADSPVDILAIGSMSNIATVIKAQPELKRKISRIISMGGAVDVPGNVRVHGFTDEHTNTQAEWNFYIDPLAAQIVLQSGIPITLVPLDATNKVPLTDEFVARAQQTKSTPAESFVARIFQKIKASITNGEYFHWDPLAAVLASKPELCDKTQQIRLTVIAKPGNDDGPDQGIPHDTFPLINGMGALRTGLDEQAAGATVRSDQGGLIDVCLHADAAAFEAEFLETIRSN